MFGTTLLFDDAEGAEKCCVNFKDKSKIIELPCKVGDTVYIKNVPLKISFIQIEKDGFTGENKITYAVLFDCNDCYSCPFYEDEVSQEGEHDCRTNGYIEFTAGDFGKTVFLTREEAEKALKEMS